MQYVKFLTMEEAEAYLPILQAHHDATINYDKMNPRIIDCIITTWDRKFSLTLVNGTWPETDGEIVDSIEPPPPAE